MLRLIGHVLLAPRSFIAGLPAPSTFPVVVAVGAAVLLVGTDLGFAATTRTDLLPTVLESLPLHFAFRLGANLAAVALAWLVLRYLLRGFRDPWSMAGAVLCPLFFVELFGPLSLVVPPAAAIALPVGGLLWSTSLVYLRSQGATPDRARWHAAIYFAVACSLTAAAIGMISR